MFQEMKRFMKGRDPKFERELILIKNQDLHAHLPRDKLNHSALTPSGGLHSAYKDQSPHDTASYSPKRVDFSLE